MEATRVLVVDDDPEIRKMLAEYLADHGYAVALAANGAAMRAEIARAVPAVVLLDIGLPGMDGYELARALKADPRLKDIRLVAMTGYGRDSDRARALAADFDEHLVKPVPAERLLAVLRSLIATR